MQSSASSSANALPPISLPQSWVHFVTGIANHGTLLRERVQRVAGYEPCGLDLVFLEEPEETSDTDGAGKEAWSKSVWIQVVWAGRGWQTDLWKCRW